MQCLHCLEAGLESYAQMTETIGATELKDMTMIGMDLHSLIEYANKMLGGLIIVDYGSSLLGAVVGIFFGLTMTDVVQKARDELLCHTGSKLSCLTRRPV